MWHRVNSTNIVPIHVVFTVQQMKLYMLKFNCVHLTNNSGVFSIPITLQRECSFTMTSWNQSLSHISWLSTEYGGVSGLIPITAVGTWRPSLAKPLLPQIPGTNVSSINIYDVIITGRIHCEPGLKSLVLQVHEYLTMLQISVWMCDSWFWFGHGFQPSMLLLSGWAWLALTTWLGFQLDISSPPTPRSAQHPQLPPFSSCSVTRNDLFVSLFFFFLVLQEMQLHETGNLPLYSQLKKVILYIVGAH